MLALGDHVQVDLGDVVTSTLEPTADGAEWFVHRIDGWAAASQRDTRFDPTSGPGTLRPRAIYGGRSLEVHGLVEAPTRTAAWDAYYRCTGALPGIQGAMDLVVHEEPVKRLRVVQDGPPEVGEPVNGAFEFTLKLLAEYPFKRELAAVTIPVLAGATVEHTAAGKAPAEIEVTLTSAGSVDLTIGQLRLRASSLPSGAVLTSGPGFARPKRTIRSALPANSNLFSHIVQPMQWPAIAPGDNTIHQAGTAGLSIRYFPTYP
ncbi:hypothetical protein [Terrabacter terrigena]|uniref:Phage tail protein n=1 Tax=Terrabacter terrigena TaxID=574718 RepID=A0ABW3MWU6_9MICO